MKKWILLLLLMWPAWAFSQANRQIIFEDQNPRTSITEYRLYVGNTQGGPYDLITPIVIPMPVPPPPEGQDLVLQAEMAVPAPGTYYVVLTAVNTIGLESLQSEEASTTITADELRPLTLINVRITQTPPS